MIWFRFVGKNDTTGEREAFVIDCGEQFVDEVLQTIGQVKYLFPRVHSMHCVYHILDFVVIQAKLIIPRYILFI